MKVVIFCGGMGTRIRDHFELLPKPLIPVGSRPIVWHIMKYYAHFGFDDFVLCLGYKREAFVDYFFHYRQHNTDMTIELGQTDSVHFHGADSGLENWRITLADTGLRTNTGARLTRVAKYLTGQTLLLTYGDGLSTVDLDALVECHRSSGKLATVSAVHPAGRFGEIEFEDDQVLGFNEKPQTGSGFINGGFMVLETEFIDRYLSEDENCVLEADGLQRCARDGLLGAYRHEGFWQCMDTGREHQLLEEMWANGNAPWRIWDAVPPAKVSRRRVNRSAPGRLARRAS